ncbi:MAG: hypothetical protein ABSG64_07600 [Solirubrobacteraceae bacterium]|jgi:hypothetical protein
MSSAGTASAPTRIAVFGSVAERQPPRRRTPFATPPRFLSPSAAAVFERTLELITTKAPAIAAPILDRGVAVGTITRAERRELLDELSGQADPVASMPRTEQAARLRHEAFAAVRRAAPKLAQPLLAEAVKTERLTPAQERRIIERLRQGPAASPYR